MARRFLETNDIDFDDLDVDVPDNFEAMRRLTDFIALPVIAIDDEVLLGFNEPELSAALRRHRE
jgi:glutaredoxin